MVDVKEELQKHWVGLLATFIIGGTLLASVKFISQTMNNPALAAVVAGLPIGLLSMYLILSDQSRAYAKNYIFITSILLCSALVFYIIQSNMDVWNDGRKYTLVSFILVFYAILVYFRTRYSTTHKLE
jgi:hypothetical protein